MKKAYMLTLLIPVIMVLVVAIGTSVSGSKVKEIASELPEGPRIFVPEESFDWGYAPNQQRLTHKYSIINQGQDTLRILNVRTTCGCTKKQMDKTVLASNETTYVVLEFRTGAYKGKQHKSAYVTTNDSTNKSVRLSFYALIDTLNQPLIPNPWSFDFGNRTNLTPLKEFTIKNKSAEKVELSIIDYPDNFLKMPEFNKSKLDSGSEVVLKCELLKDFEPIEALNGSITIEASTEPKTRFTIPVTVGK
ncbi:DUF1573 domain-containing protein [bacterium]|nr:DUF1573 domain-containing protein [bacterium]